MCVHLMTSHTYIINTVTNVIVPRSPAVHGAEHPHWLHARGDDRGGPHKPGNHHLRLYHLHQPDVPHHRSSLRYGSNTHVSTHLAGLRWTLDSLISMRSNVLHIAQGSLTMSYTLCNDVTRDRNNDLHIV